MPQLGLRYEGANLTWDEARIRSEDASFPYPPPLIEAMILAEVRADSTPTASVLAGCLRQFALKKTTGYYRAPNGSLPALFGTAFHAAMDASRKGILQPGDLSESKLKASVDVGRGDFVTLSGTVDFLRPGVLVSDWKTKVYIPQGFTPPKAHRAQVNIYNWLAWANDYEPAPTWELVYVSQTWILRFQGETLPVAEVGEYVRKRLARWAYHAEEGTLPPPVPELFEESKGKPVPPCAWCPVRDACLMALKAEGERPF